MTTLRDLVAERAARCPHRSFLADARSERSFGFAMLHTAADAWRRELDAAGVPLGARVLLDVEDPLAFCAVHLAVIAAGRCSTPVNPAAPPAEAERTRRALRPWLVVSDRVAVPGMQVNPATGRPASPAAPLRVADPSDRRAGLVALLTSGSTGTPKTVVLTEHQLLHAARCVVDHHTLSATDRGFNPLPLFHINAQVVALLATLLAGGTLVLDRRFHRTGFWQLLVERGITWVNAVPAILSILALEDIPAMPPELRFIRSASAPLPATARERVAARSGVTVVESYGMTEAASQITATPLHGGHPPGSVGRPVGVELDVVGPDGRRCAPDVVGRVRIRGESVISTYAEGVAAERFDAAGWLDTGDLGRLDAHGYFYLAGRADDVVNRGGELVHPQEIEEVLLGEAAVAMAAVTPRPHEVLGAVPVAWIQPVQVVDEEQADELVHRLRVRCERYLSQVKRPVEFRIVAGLPRSATGKVLRRQLRELLIADTRCLEVSPPMTAPPAPVLPAPAAHVSGRGHIGAVDLVRVLTFTSVIAVHVVAAVNPSGSIPAGGALMLLHFTREVFFALTAFVLVHRYRGGLRAGPFWRRRFLLVGAPYLAWSVLYTGLALVTVPLTPGAALAQLVHNVLTGTAWYHLYFLVVAMQFYLLFPLFLRLLGGSAGHRGRHWWLLAISAVLQVGIDAGVHLAHPKSGIAAELMHYSGTFVGSYVFYLVLGGVAALHAEQVQAWVRGHPVIVLVAFVLTGAAAEGYYLRSLGHVSPLRASAVFQPVTVPWCVAVMTALFALGVTWAARRGAGLGSRVVEVGCDYSFGVFLVHPMVLWALTHGPSEWLSRRLPALWVTLIVLAVTTAVSVLVVEVLRHSPLSLVLTGKPCSLRPRAVRSSRSESSASALPLRLGAGRT